LFLTFEWLLVIWLGMLGGCIGSFLNVVIYRLPRGKNLARPGSCCPSCDAAIRPYHNIPVLGWVMLGGRCYDCRAPIAIRYPLIEAVTALFFLGSAIMVFGRAEEPSPYADGLAWGIYTGLTVAFSSVLCMVAILIDRQRVPRGLYVSLVVGLGLMSVCLWWP
jgi:prepilin signal peptidase PulO-like enzyme (type II secretory pathway)